MWIIIVSLLLVYTNQVDGELGQVGCFHRHSVTWTCRQQGEEQKWRSLFHNVFPWHVGTGVGNPVSFTSVCAFAQWLCPLWSLLTLRFVAWTRASSLSPGCTNHICFSGMQLHAKQLSLISVHCFKANFLSCKLQILPGSDLEQRSQYNTCWYGQPGCESQVSKHQAKSQSPELGSFIVTEELAHCTIGIQGN